MDLIVATAKDWAIGRNNDLLFSLPEDMKFFRQMTMGKVVILGRKTLDSFPGGRPLPQRRNLVLTRNPHFHRDGCEVFSSPEDLLLALSQVPEEDQMVIGGEEIYRLFLPLCQNAYVTRIDQLAEGADKFMPNLDQSPEWKLTSSSPMKEENGIRFCFCRYERT